MVKNHNIVFLIGAGFSAPFGLPVMSNFIDKARDLFVYDQVKYASVGKTLKLIGKYSIVKNYLNINLYNIEDLLSIAYMDSAITKKSRTMKLIIEFIKIVIDNYTGQVTNGLVNFAELIANASFKKGNTLISHGREEYYQLFYEGKKLEYTSFGLITLNYDLIVENSLSHLASKYGRFYELGNKKNELSEYFSTTIDSKDVGVRMAKLHGSLDRTIIPPTWNKNMNPEIRSDWLLASKLLRNATHIFFLGYSLPSTDNYIKYLIASSLCENQRLKKISVVTKDADGQTYDRYKSLFGERLIVHNIDILKFFDFIGYIRNEFDFDDFDETFLNFYSPKIEQDRMVKV